MREPILPPPPPLRVAVWAALNALWFRTAARVLHKAALQARAAALGAHVAEAVRAVRRLAAGTTSRPVPLAALAREERATAVEVRRACATTDACSPTAPARVVTQLLRG